ncbi:hypothetical protein [Streptomyces jumonjinensis]
MVADRLSVPVRGAVLSARAQAVAVTLGAVLWVVTVMVLIVCL